MLHKCKVIFTGYTAIGWLVEGKYWRRFIAYTVLNCLFLGLIIVVI